MLIKKSLRLCASACVLSLLMAACSSGGAASSTGSAAAGDSAAPAAGSEKAIVMRIGDTTAPDNVLSVTLSEMATAINERSGGRIEATVYPSGQLGTLRTMTEGLQNGTIEVCTQSPGGVASFLPIMSVLELPYMFDSHQEVYKVADSEIGDELNQKFLDATGIRIMGYWLNLLRHTTNNVRPINTVEDFNGLKLRVPETKTVMETIRGLGANPTPMAFNEVYTALSQGAIDGQENPPVVIHASKLYEVQKYLSLTHHVYTPTIVMISEDFYQSLPDDLRVIVDEEMEAAKHRGRENAERLDDELLEELKSLMEVNEVDTTGFRDHVQGAYDAVIAESGDEAQQYIDRMLAMLEE